MSPASITMMSSSQRKARQFMPNSPRPPKGMIFNFFVCIWSGLMLTLSESENEQIEIGASNWIRKRAKLSGLRQGKRAGPNGRLLLQRRIICLISDEVFRETILFPTGGRSARVLVCTSAEAAMHD